MKLFKILFQFYKIYFFIAIKTWNCISGNLGFWYIFLKGPRYCKLDHLFQWWRPGNEVWCWEEEEMTFKDCLSFSPFLDVGTPSHTALTATYPGRAAPQVVSSCSQTQEWGRCTSVICTLKLASTKHPPKPKPRETHDRVKMGLTPGVYQEHKPTSSLRTSLIRHKARRTPLKWLICSII